MFIHVGFTFNLMSNSIRIKNDDGEPCVSYIALTMDKKLDLNVYKNRGRPTKAEKIKTSAKVKKDLAALRKELNYNEGAEILLAISLATNDMTRHVAMYPEVFLYGCYVEYKQTKT